MIHHRPTEPNEPVVLHRPSESVTPVLTVIGENVHELLYTGRVSSTGDSKKVGDLDQSIQGKHLAEPNPYRGMYRRQTLLGVTAVLAGIGGCSSRSLSNQQGVALAGVELGNATEESQVFHLLIESEGDIVHWDAHEVEPSSGDQLGSEVVNPGIANGPGDVEIKCRVEDQQTVTDFGDQDFHGECVLGAFLYGFRGDRVLSSHPTTADFELPESVECPASE